MGLKLPNIKELFNQIPEWIYWGPQAISAIKFRFSRTKLGILWVLMGTILYVGSLSLVFSHVLNYPFNETISYISVSLIFWTFMSSTINESAQAFIVERTAIQNTACPILCYPFRVIFLNILYLLLNLTVIALILPIFGELTLASIYLFIPSVILFILVVAAASLLISIASIRFRDIPFLIQNLLQILFFVTPIIWRMEDMQGRFKVLEYNPLYLLIEMIRMPLLNSSVNGFFVFSCIGLLIVTTCLLCLVLKSCKHKIVYWT